MLPEFGLNQMQGKNYVPLGWIVTKSESRYPYWQVRRSDDKKLSFSKAFTATGLSDNQAAVFCFRSAWEHERKNFGRECPYAFEGAGDFADA